MPGSDALHSALTGANIHVPYRFTYADATAREAEAGAVPGDVGCLALQQDDNSLWILTDDDPLTWVAVGGSGSYLPLAGGTMSGELAMADELVSEPEILDYSETVNAIGSAGGGTQDIDLTAGNVVSVTVDTSETTFTFSNPSASGKACSFTLILTNGGSQTVNWPASVDWAGGTAPELTTSGVDILTFVTVDAGTIWYGFAAGLDMS
jgi:hypothetical protein